MASAGVGYTHYNARRDYETYNEVQFYGQLTALLPFSLVPAVALLFAFRATAQTAEQRQRSARLLALSQDRQRHHRIEIACRQHGAATHFPAPERWLRRCCSALGARAKPASLTGLFNWMAVSVSCRARRPRRLDRRWRFPHYK